MRGSRTEVAKGSNSRRLKITFLCLWLFLTLRISRIPIQIRKAMVANPEPIIIEISSMHMDDPPPSQNGFTLKIIFTQGLIFSSEPDFTHSVKWLLEKSHFRPAFRPGMTPCLASLLTVISESPKNREAWDVLMISRAIDFP